MKISLLLSEGLSMHQSVGDNPFRILEANRVAEVVVCWHL